MSVLNWEERYPGTWIVELAPDQFGPGFAMVLSTLDDRFRVILYWRDSINSPRLKPDFRTLEQAQQAAEITYIEGCLRADG
jgi:hypothetical protein